MSKPKNLSAHAQFRLRVRYGDEIAVGPGKVDLLEAIDRTQSLSAAARELGMSYRRAWLLADTMNRCLREPVVESASGGARGGGSALTATGREVVRLYRSIEARAAQAAEADLVVLKKLLK